MNDITPKEAIANLDHIYGMVAPDIQRSLDVAIKALEIDEQTYKDAYDQGYADGWKERYGEPDGRPKGEWIDRMADKGYVECPFCGKEITGGDLNFCVKCGADMRKGGAEWR